MSKAYKSEVSDLIERLEVFEEKYNVRLESLSAFRTRYENGEYSVEVFGEIYPRTGATIEHDIEIVGSLHDSQGKVIELEDRRISEDGFFGFQAFHFYFSTVIVEPTKIRVYVRAY